MSIREEGERVAERIAREQQRRSRAELVLIYMQGLVALAPICFFLWHRGAHPLLIAGGVVVALVLAEIFIHYDIRRRVRRLERKRKNGSSGAPG